jgi:hypothetical protein
VGHSGLANPGTDIICAAVSVLTENLGNTFEQILGLAPKIRNSEGYYSLKIDDSDAQRDTELLFASFVLGIRSLQVMHPDRISMELPGGD